MFFESIYFHCTFDSYLPRIFKEGLVINSGNRNWEISTGDIYLHENDYVAESMCETADIVSDEVFLSGITILAIDMSGLEDLLQPDPNIDFGSQEENPGSFIFLGNRIPPARIYIWKKVPSQYPFST